MKKDLHFYSCEFQNYFLLLTSIISFLPKLNTLGCKRPFFIVICPFAGNSITAVFYCVKNDQIFVFLVVNNASRNGRNTIDIKRAPFTIITLWLTALYDPSTVTTLFLLNADVKYKRRCKVLTKSRNTRKSIKEDLFYPKGI